MFTPSFFIDTVQETKRVITNQVFKDATLNKAANDYITAQTAFAKMLANNAIEMTKYSVDSVSKVLFPKKEEVKAKTAKKTADTDINTQGE
jgi:preprotein translocase subunit SecE